MENEEAIDLQKLLQIVIKHKREVLTIVVSCTLIALITAFLLPKTYESTALVRAKAQNNTAGLSVAAAASAMAVLGVGGNVSAPTMVYTELMKSRTVIEPIIAKLDLTEEKKELLTVKKFVESNLDIKNTKGTDLIEITATGKSPEEAQMISSEVVNGFLLLMTQLNQNQQSLMVKFLTERMDVAKKEMEDAEATLEKYRQQEKIYVPDEQAKALIEKLTTFDKSISELQVTRDSSAANLQGVNEQLKRQNSALLEFHIADNETIQKIRNNIIDKQTQLVVSEQRYTDKHPTVIALKKELAALTSQLNQEVEKSVQAGTNTLNPIHADLLAQKAKLEVGIQVNDASLNSLNSLRAKAEDETSKLSDAGLGYIRLERNVKIAQEVYGTLVKSYEDARIQEAMDSMDIQIVDPADLPKKPAGPRKLLITVIGGVAGMMFAFAYILVLYNRKNGLKYTSSSV